MKSIIMGAEDVRGILDGRKTMARVPVKQSVVDRFVIDTWGELLGSFTDKFGDYPSIDDCPYHPGDVMWVRETWGDYGGQTSHYIYRADYPLSAKGYWHEKEHINWCDFPKWNSPVTMPREAARLFLRVTDVRAERVQEITEKDAIREGIMYTDFGMNEDMGKLSVDGGETFHELKPRHYPGYNAGGATNPSQCVYTARSAFAGEWDARNAKRGYGWDSNPFVWVIEFERVEKGEEL